MASTESDTTKLPGTKSRSLTQRLTKGLMETYHHINHSYYATQQQPVAQPIQRQLMDANSNYIPLQGEILNNRYRIDRALGKGSFGRVFECKDLVRNVHVACKIIKNKRAFIKQAETEVSILDTFAPYADEMNLVQLQDHFFHEGHPCLIFELLSTNLYELLRGSKFAGISLSVLSKLSYQILVALNSLNNMPDGQQILHCDLKPENIMLISPTRSQIKLIDFGSACFSDNTPFTYIQSRYYRSPEILLGLPYDTRIDMFSLGCLMAEMYTGRPLFDGQSEIEQLRRHEQILGPVKQEFIEASQKARSFYTRDSRTQRWVLSQGDTRLEPTTLRQVLSAKGGSPSPQFEQFLDLVSRLLQIDPSMRIKTSEALQHPYFIQEAVGTIPSAVVKKQVCEESAPSIFTSPVLPQSPCVPTVCTVTSNSQCIAPRKRKPSFPVPVTVTKRSKTHSNSAFTDPSARPRSQRLTRTTRSSQVPLHFDSIAQRTRSRQSQNVVSWPSPTIEVR